MCIITTVLHFPYLCFKMIKKTLMGPLCALFAPISSKFLQFTYTLPMTDLVAKDSEKIARLKRELDNVPALPGVYLWKNAAGEVIYVGKAKQLRARMRQYVNFQDDRAKIPLLVDAIETFDYIVVTNEHESLVLENNLIKQYAPFFNADFKDDKSYPFIALTMGDTFPAIKYTREKHRSDTKYFGPFTDSRAARELVDIAR